MMEILFFWSLQSNNNNKKKTKTKQRQNSRVYFPEILKNILEQFYYGALIKFS